MLKTLGWVTVGLILGAMIRAWLVPASSPPNVVGSGSVGVSDYAALRARVSLLERSDAAFASEYAELASQTAALQEQVRAFSDSLDLVKERQSRAPRPARTSSSPRERNLESTIAAQDVPGNLSGVDAEPGHVFVYEVTGSSRGSIWGTDIYTDDSSIAVAAVHAGILQPDETGTVMLTVLPGRETYRGSVRHGVASSDYPSWERSYSLQRLY